jgi:hypothetical protein
MKTITVKPKLSVVRSGGKATITHFQSIKQSANYQTAECTYGVTVEVVDTDRDIVAGQHRLEQLVEDMLTSKFREQRKLLQSIGTETKVTDSE